LKEEGTMPKGPVRGHVRKNEGAKRPVIDRSLPTPTVSAGGIGNMNTSQYTVGEGMPKDAGGKPPYRVPSMAEIAKIKPNGLTVASTFSGCGGSSLGYRMAGFRVLWANEFVPAARDSYRANMAAGTVLDERDVRTVRPEEILRACKLRKGQLDFFDGSPPCASFSTAGKRQEGWGKVKKYSDTEQRTDDLFFEYVRLVRGIQPRTFVAENVSGLVKGTAKGTFLEILRELKACGYRVTCKVLDAQWLGVPQQRQRTIFVGVREDLTDVDGQLLTPAHPAPLPYRYSVREAIPWICRAVEDTLSSHPTFNQKRDVDFSAGVSPTVRAGGTGQLYVEPESRMDDAATGRQWDQTPIGGQSDRYFQLVKPDLDGSCPTVTAAGGNAGLASVCHPTQRRKFSIAELKRICAFPDCFILTGSYAQQWERLGRAVPPLMMRAIAEAVRDKILLRVRS
jgi:DNA (cytosine-5)-methyltransferase 1